MSRITFATGVVLLFFGLASAAPDLDTFSDTLRAVETGSVDKHIENGSTRYDHDSGQPSFGRWVNPFPPPNVEQISNGIFGFDLSSVPDTVLVTGAEFGFCQYNDDTSGTPSYYVSAYYYADTLSESLFYATSRGLPVSESYDSHQGWNAVPLTEAGKQVIAEALVTDVLRLSCVAAGGWWDRFSYSYGSGDPETLRPYLLVSYLPTGVEESPKPQAQSCGLTVRPNPCRRSTVLHLTAGPLDPSTALSIYNASGQQVLSQVVRSSSFILQTSSLPAGVYVVRCTSAGRALLARFTVCRD